MIKKHFSPEYNYIFNTHNGMFVRWGSTTDKDPDYAPAPEILDIEVTTKCANGCPFCYKNNTVNGTNMSMYTFKSIVDKMPTLLQIAFGADASCTSNPDLWAMMSYARLQGIVPNITVADISDDVADKLAFRCGAVAVSRYADKNKCYDSVKRLTDRDMTQINIHAMVSAETQDQVRETLADYLTDPRLEKLNAIVLLSLKQKGRGEKFNSMSREDFSSMVNFAIDSKIPIGFDSCSAHKFLDSVKTHEKFKQFELLTEPCESSCFSSYIDVHGSFFPCSFTEGTEGWEEGIKISDYESFDQVWNHPRTVEFRNRLISNGRHCPLYQI